MTTPIFRCIPIILLISLGSSSWAATPTHGRGERLSFAEETQQELLRRLRKQVAVEEIMLRHESGASKTIDPLATAPPVLHETLLERLKSQDGISSATLDVLKTSPAVSRPIELSDSSSFGQSSNQGFHTQTVARFFDRLDEFVTAHYQRTDSDMRVAEMAGDALQQSAEI